MKNQKCMSADGCLIPLQLCHQLTLQMSTGECTKKRKKKKKNWFGVRVASGHEVGSKEQ